MGNISHAQESYTLNMFALSSTVATRAFAQKVSSSRSVNSRSASVVVKAERELWYPGAKAPEYLDGSMAGDYGFDPLRLGVNKETLPYLQEAELMNGRCTRLLAFCIRIPTRASRSFGKLARRITTSTLKRWSSRKLSLWASWKR